MDVQSIKKQMKIHKWFRLGCFLVLLATLLVSVNAAAHFRVSLDTTVVPNGQPVSGRLLIFMTRNDRPLATIEPDFTNPNAVYISGTEISDLKPGKTIDIDADELSFPGPFSTAAAGEYQIMALLDRNHSYTYYDHADA